MTMPPNALCFGEEFPATGAPCLVEIAPTGLMLHFEASSSALNGITVPFTALTVSAGGLDHDQLVVKWGEEPSAKTLYLKDPALIGAFRRAAPPDLTQHFEAAATKVREARSHRRTMWGLALGAIVGAALFLWLGSDWVVELAVNRIPIEWERQIGESAYRDFLSHQEIVKEGPTVVAVKEMTQRLTEQIPKSPYKFEISVVKSDVVNAFALPGGYIVVFTGLMKKAESGEEVAGVLSHELNHVLQRHGMDRVVKSLGLMAVVTILVGDAKGLAGLMKQVGFELFTLKFGRAQETEADLTGLRLLHRAKIDPSGMIRFFERLAEKDEGRMEWLSTHPMSRARADRLKAEFAALPNTAPEPFTFEWKNVQESLGVQPVATP